MCCNVYSHTHQRPAARIVEESVIYDYKQGRRIELPVWIEEVLRRVTADEDSSRRYWELRRAEVELLITRLEEQSIFSGKKEDMGQ